MQLWSSVVGLQHHQVQYTQDRNTIDGEMGCRQKEADKGGYDNGDKPCRQFTKGHNGIGNGHGMGEKGYRDDEVEAPPDFS